MIKSSSKLRNNRLQTRGHERSVAVSAVLLGCQEQIQRKLGDWLGTTTHRKLPKATVPKRSSQNSPAAVGMLLSTRANIRPYRFTRSSHACVASCVCVLSPEQFDTEVTDIG